MTVDIIIIIVLLLLGIALILAEIFLLPGVSIAGIGGGIILVGSIVYAFLYVGETAGFITIGASCIIGIGSFVFLIKSKAIERISLKTNIDSTIDQSEKEHLKIGSIGTTLSRLNPIGNVQYDEGAIAESKSFTGEYIDTETKVRIIKIDGSTIFVETI